jgi:CDP-glucose 4,6-dehydratase
LGASVEGLSADENSSRINWNTIKPRFHIPSKILDIRDIETLNLHLQGNNYDFIFHLAAQPLVVKAYSNPLETINANVVGSANILELFRTNAGIKNLIIVTSDKVYLDMPPFHYSESSNLGASEVYGASKAMVEILVNAYKKSFIKQIENEHRGIATVRAGNVIGGGDWSESRLVPDIFRALQTNQILKIRNPAFVRPWQHVFDVTYGYLMLGKSLYENPKLFSSAWNFSNPEFIMPVQQLVNLFAIEIGKNLFPALQVEKSNTAAFFESPTLSLDSKKSNQDLGWKSFMTPKLAISETFNWYKEYESGLETRDLLAYNIMSVKKYLKMVGVNQN